MFRLGRSKNSDEGDVDNITLHNIQNPIAIVKECHQQHRNYNMIPSGDHTSRNLLLRRISSWSEITSPQQQQDEFSLASVDDDGDLSSPLLPALEYEEESVDAASIRSARKYRKWKLWIFFVLMVVSGVGNVVLAKLQSLPM